MSDFVLTTAAKEDILKILEFYRQSAISSGEAELLGMEREDFIRHAVAQGIPYFQLQGDELRRELDASKKL